MKTMPPQYLFEYDDIAALRPCWLQDGRADELRYKVGDGVSPMQIATDESVSIADRRWLLTNLLARGPRPNLRALVAWSCDTAASVLELVPEAHRPPCAHAIDLARRWAQGEAVSSDQLYDAARAAARAADVADRAAADVAAYAADRAAARVAADVAADVAYAAARAYAAADVAAYVAARVAADVVADVATCAAYAAARTADRAAAYAARARKGLIDLAGRFT